MQSSTSLFLFLATTLIACGGSKEDAGTEADKSDQVELVINSHEVLVSEIIKALSNGDESICDKVIVGPHTIKEALSCPAELEKPMLASFEQDSTMQLARCEKMIKGAKAAGIKPVLVSIDNVEQKKHTPKGDEIAGCKAKVDFTELTVTATIKATGLGNETEVPTPYPMVNIGGRYYMSK